MATVGDKHAVLCVNLLTSLGLRMAATGLVATVLLVQGCATLSENECISADWYAIGYEDGLKGYPAARIGDHRKACADYAIVPDLTKYADGRDVGLESFCQPHNGYRLGRRGVSYGGVCRSGDEAEFLEAYYAGRELHGLESRIAQLAREIREGERALEKLTQRISALEQELVIAGTSAKVRAALLSELRTLEHEALATEQAIADADAERHNQQTYFTELSAQTRW